ncbi:MAG: DUF3658 domain-containing protein [Ginsengibacter sp.]
MIHIVFQHADVDALRKSFELDEMLLGRVREIKDDYAVGPLQNLYTEDGITARLDWWRQVLAGGDSDGKADTGEVDDNATVRHLKQLLNNEPDEVAWLWIGPNKHDISGYYWLISQLEEFLGRLFILHLHNLPFLSEKGSVFYPENIFQIPAKEFIKAKKLARPVTPSEFEIDSEEWKKICETNSGVRTLDSGKKLRLHAYHEYDHELLKFITTEFQKVNKIMHQYFSKSKYTTGDMYLLWRIKQLITEQKLIAQGEIKGMKDFEIKLKTTESLELPVE